MAGELEPYLNTMARARTWGDELTLRAFADCFEVTVHVVASTEGSWHHVYSPSALPDGSEPKKHVFLTYLSPVHYDALTAAAPYEDGASPVGRRASPAVRP